MSRTKIEVEKRTGLYSKKERGRFCFETNSQAVEAVLDLILSSKSKIVVISDIDDSLLDSGNLFLTAINAVLTNFPDITDEEVATNGGRFSTSPTIQKALSSIQPPLSYEELVDPIFNNVNLHERMPPLKGAKKLIKTIQNCDSLIVGYVTARPQTMGQVTERSLRRHHLPQAPIIHAENKTEILSQIASRLPDDYLIVYLDDIRDYLLAIANDSELSRKILPMCVASRHNQMALKELQALGIRCGTLSEIAQFISDLHDQESQH